MKKFFVTLSIVIFFSLVSFASKKDTKIEIKSVSVCTQGYLLNVEGKPFFIKGVIYSPTPIGKGYDYDFYQDPNKPWLVDGKLMKEAGINCVRVYKVSENLAKTKEFIRDMYEKFGIYTIVSDWLGLWDKPAPNYADKNFWQKQKERILKIVKELKDEKGLLMWVLGNENDYTFSGNVTFWTSDEIENLEPALRPRKRAQIYYEFVNELAGEIKKVDPNRPVALGCGEINFLRIAASICTNIDVLAIIFYRGKNFANIFESIRNFFDKPILISEFGADSYDAYRNVENQDIQAEYIVCQWTDIYKNSLYSGNPKGNCIGATLFEWTDEWWKHNEGYHDDWSVHNTEAGWSQGAYTFDNRAKNGLNMNEEWFGIVALSEEKEAGVNKRIPKKAYWAIKEFFESIEEAYQLSQKKYQQN